MKKLALVTMMVLGTASVASASPYFTASGRASFHIGHREPVRVRQYQPRVQPTRVMLPPRSVVVRDYRTNASWEVTPCQDAHYNVSGFYDGSAGAVQLTQRGNRIYGSFANGGIMEGFIENGKITYHWSLGDTHGLGYWYVDGRGRLIGTWGTNNSDTSGGNWNLRLTSSSRY